MRLRVIVPMGQTLFNTYPLVVELAKLRAEKARLMGYPNYAAYSLEKTMAKTPQNVQTFLQQLTTAYLPKAQQETREIEAYARQTMGQRFSIAALRPHVLFCEDETREVPFLGR